MDFELIRKFSNSFGAETIPDARFLPAPGWDKRFLGEVVRLSFYRVPLHIEVVEEAAPFIPAEKPYNVSQLMAKTEPEVIQTIPPEGQGYDRCSILQQHGGAIQVCSREMFEDNKVYPA